MDHRVFFPKHNLWINECSFPFHYKAIKHRSTFPLFRDMLKARTLHSIAIDLNRFTLFLFNKNVYITQRYDLSIYVVIPGVDWAKSVIYTISYLYRINSQHNQTIQARLRIEPEFAKPNRLGWIWITLYPTLMCSLLGGHVGGSFGLRNKDGGSTRT